ncbi:MAG: glucan ABC transporter ATP-binding protein/ permease [Methylobacterium sp.]|nr:glucan ABC transporter ATP-binding protein/ permease [Methylobacterium sp.]MCA3602893.1 glucan ABC transporter ATP-binding protein/ permease [Methylobacterium sp.]MCA3614743.1 glucan ABC transporter ATP-binding protein/ permease [Methylobacterium sp.]
MALARLYIRVLLQLGPEIRLALLLVLANLLLAVAQFVEPWLFGQIINVLTAAQGASGKPMVDQLFPLIGAWLVFGLFTIGAGVLIAMHADRLSHRQRLQMMADYFEHVLTLPLSYHTSTHSGRTLKVMLDGANGMFWLWLGFLRDHCAALLALLVLLPLTLLINWRLGLLLVVLVVFFAVMMAIVVNRTARMQDSVEGYHSELAEHTSDAIGNIPVIQSFTRVQAELQHLRSVIDRLLSAQLPVLAWWALVSVATRASSTITVTAIFLLGTYLHLNQLATIGDIVTFVGYSTLLIGKLEAAVGFINQLFMQAPKLKEFLEVIDTVPQVQDRPNATDAGRLTGEVVFDGVSFSYDGKRPAILDLSLVAKQGQTIALVGSTGSGKSTTLGLLHRAFDPQSGAIRIDGKDIRDFTLQSLRRNIAVVFQEPMLFARTIRENLEVGRSGASNEEMMAALERAQALEFIERQSNGLDTIVGERGRSLSGGERQRLSIARALLKDPPILILDEATSALDAGTEQKLQLALEEVMKGRTTFVIAHRLATIRNADHIVMLEKGRIVEEGTFDQLVALNGRFAALARAQFMAGADSETVSAK